MLVTFCLALEACLPPYSSTLEFLAMTVVIRFYMRDIRFRGPLFAIAVDCHADIDALRHHPVFPALFALWRLDELLVRADQCDFPMI